MLYTGGNDTCYIQELVIHVICRLWYRLNAGGCDTCYMQEVVVHVKCRRL